MCAEQEVCPLENDNTTLIMVLGGETTRENRENEHSTSIEIIGPNGLCRLSGVPDLPEARGKMCAAYDPSGAVIVCGGGPRFWRPSNNCWQLVKVKLKVIFKPHFHCQSHRDSLATGLRYLRCIQFMEQQQLSTEASSGCWEDQLVKTTKYFHVL